MQSKRQGSEKTSTPCELLRLAAILDGEVLSGSL
jgi:hypothetical protein